MELFFEFFSFQDASIISVVIGSILLTSSSAVVGTFTFLKKKALLGDAVAHAVLPGICLAFILSGTKNPLILIIGAFITGWLSLITIDFIGSRTKLKEDTAIALVLSVFFGVGILMLTSIQHSGNAAQTGLDSFLFGNAAALIGTDLIVFAFVSLVLLGVVSLLFKEMKILAFDPSFAQVIGLPVKTLELILTSITVLAVVTGIQAVGVVLMAAMLITPAAAARFWTQNALHMTLIAGLLGAFSGLAGAFVSYSAPTMPTGPWIVMVISIIALISFFLAPKRGILSRNLQQRSLRHLIMDENLLKELYHIGEKDNSPFKERSIAAIMRERFFPEGQLKSGLIRLKRKGFLVNKDGRWKFTQLGYEKGQRMVKLHRLWELYLSEYLKIAPDHVHEDAETIEHVITPELEARLEKMLAFPETDPHEKKIPY
jgi:manganese/zinc/iron transport system permease protein